jgi:hypothetical protein
MIRAMQRWRAGPGVFSRSARRVEETGSPARGPKGTRRLAGPSATPGAAVTTRRGARGGRAKASIRWQSAHSMLPARFHGQPQPRQVRNLTGAAYASSGAGPGTGPSQCGDGGPRGRARTIPGT